MFIGERIQELRKTKGLSQEQLAEVLNVSRQAVSKWEGDQSLPEIEKLVEMSTLFGVSIDYILKGETASIPEAGRRNDTKLGSQVVSAVATMLLLISIFATFGKLSDGSNTLDLFGGLIIESVGVMLMLLSWFLMGGPAQNKPLLIANILLAGILPTLLISQLLLRQKINAIPELTPALALVFICVYAVLCAAAIYVIILRKKQSK